MDNVGVYKEYNQEKDGASIPNYVSKLKWLCDRLSLKFDCSVIDIESRESAVLKLVEVKLDIWNDEKRYIVSARGNASNTTKMAAAKKALLTIYRDVGYSLEQDAKSETPPKDNLGERAEGDDLRNIESSSENHNIDEYIVTNARNVVDQKICPICHNNLKIRKCNVPAYGEDGNVSGLYLSDIWLCDICDGKFMLESDWSNLINRVSGISGRYFRPSNLYYSGKIRNKDYLYSPLAGFELYYKQFNVETMKPANANTQLNMMNKESFLKKGGYSTKISVTERRKILDKLSKKHAKREIADILIMNIRLKKNRLNYSEAVNAWTADLKYIVEQQE